MLMIKCYRALGIVFLIGRSKLVPDFAITTHFVHLVVVTLYTGRIPRNAMWWVAMAASSGTAMGLAMWGCRYRELRPISFGGGNGTANGAAAGDDSQGAGEGGGIGDEEMGYSRGRGRGRGRDGAGEYEMVKMNGDTGG
jgi:protein SYS1